MLNTAPQDGMYLVQSREQGTRSAESYSLKMTHASVFEACCRAQWAQALRWT